MQAQLGYRFSFKTSHAIILFLDLLFIFLKKLEKFLHRAHYARCAGFTPT